MPYLPAAGEVVIFDRSWYNRAGVERVMGFATPEQVDYFLKYAPAVERSIIHSGVILIKYWLEVDMDVQDERLRARPSPARFVMLGGTDCWFNVISFLLSRLSSRWAGTTPVQFSSDLTLANLCYLWYNGETSSDH